MSETEKFLARWSRLKRAAEAGSREEAPAIAEAVGVPPGVREPVVDLSSLPALDSIDAGTDVSVFMRPGVPAALRHAALRRAWANDPTIRDFRGLQEGDWDFSNPESVPGFGSFVSSEEIDRLARGLFGGDAPELQQITQAAPRDDEHVDLPHDEYDVIDKSHERSIPAPEAATKTGESARQTVLKASIPARRHGSALPK